MTVLRLRTARPDAADVQFLWQMLVEAASWRPAEPKISVSEAIADPSHARYVADWGRDGDLGVIAEAAGMEPPGGVFSLSTTMATALSTQRFRRSQSRS